MLGTPIAILAAVALLMPGFIVAELAFERGIYVPADQIARIELLPAGTDGIIRS
jgi:hypothetical protein